MFFRSRPYMKNDNCHVEQKNYTHVRALFGNKRLDQERVINLMNEIYQQYWNPLQNFFLPSYRLIDKKRIGAKVLKIHEKPTTPFDRIMASPLVSKERKDQLKNLKESLNPFELRVQLESKLTEFNKEV